MSKKLENIEYKRKNGAVISPSKRLENFDEFHKPLSLREQSLQGGRCMECGVPFCQFGGMIEGRGSGCPLHNLVPETNELIFTGNWAQAYYRLSETHGLPEFTSRVCPALCENACTHGLHTEPVSTKENERAIIEYAYEHNLVKEVEPTVRTGKTVAIVGSGPSGLAAAQLLNKRGHKVTVFERHDRVGGLLRYGIPNMKLDKRIIDRRIKLMEKAGIEFICNTNIGQDLKGEDLIADYDRVLLCCGASRPRDLDIPGRDANGIYFAVDFLSEVTKALIDCDYDSEEIMSSDKFTFKSLKDKNVLVIGGGDTGNDCVGTSLRLGARSVTQLEMMPQAPKARLDSNPWPEWANVMKTDYGQEEAIYKFGNDPRVYETTVREFIKDEAGLVKAAKTVKLNWTRDKKSGRLTPQEIEGSEETINVDLVLISAGFLGSEGYVTDTFGVKCNMRNNVETDVDSYETSNAGVFVAGDMRRGQSLVVWAIAEGRAAAKAIDESLMGYSNL